MSKGNDTCSEGMKVYGTFIPFLLWFLTPSEFKVWTYLKNNTKSMDPSKKLIARRCNLDIKRVKKGLLGLELLNLIKPLGKNDNFVDAYELLPVKPLFDLFSPFWISETKQLPKRISKLKKVVQQYELKLKNSSAKCTYPSSILTGDHSELVKQIVLFSKKRGFFNVLPDV